MAELPRKVEINIASIRVAGFGGLCMVVASLLCAVSLPQTRWFILAGIAAGTLFGVARIVSRRDRTRPWHDDGSLHLVERAPSRPHDDRGSSSLVDEIRLAHA